jgi:hypothetical protein
MADIKSIENAARNGASGYLVRDNRTAGYGDHYKDRPWDLLAITEVIWDGESIIEVRTRRVDNAIFTEHGTPFLPAGVGVSLGRRSNLERATAAEKRFSFLPASELRELAPESASEPIALTPTEAPPVEPVTIERLFALMATLLDEQRTTNALLRQHMRATSPGQQMTLIPVASSVTQPPLPIAANGAITGAR